jgi:hypothetical protein
VATNPAERDSVETNSRRVHAGAEVFMSTLTGKGMGNPVSSGSVAARLIVEPFEV